ncbi:M3 family metallopeptidase [Christensenella intestinihominis]|uniref:M3 family metallopeptidase n=1 Tax=Christensenella intestinihominis TaxID=1851429 RepID=UPI00082F2409|nr:M3 family metallopeptidase [Christensenella intestinihominis]
MKKHLRITALAAAILLVAAVAGGCGLMRTIVTETLDEISSARPSPSFSPQPFPSLDPQDTEATPFSEIEYVHPDVEETAARFYEMADEIDVCEDAQELKDLFEEGEALYQDYNTMMNLASLMSTMDLADEKWAEEEAYTAQGFTAVDMAYEEYYIALYYSPFREEIEQNWQPGYFDNVVQDEEWYAEGTRELYEREAALLSEYAQKRATAKVLWDGQELSYEDINMIGDTDEYYGALAAWHEAYEPVLGDIYVELVKTRNELAQVLGYDNYTEMVFAQNGKDYSPEMMETMTGEIVEYLVPVYTEIWDYPIEGEAEYEKWADFLQSTFYDMDSTLGGNFQLMREYGLIDWEPRTDKSPGAYTTYLDTYYSPFVLMSYTGDEYSMTTLVHEFGHFNNYLETGVIAEARDVSEIYSQALELLASNHYGEYFGEETGYEMQYNTLSDKLDSFVEQAYYTAVEQEVYSLDPEGVTLEAVEEIAGRQAERFGLTSNRYEDQYAYDWVAIPHIYESPYYTFAYATSADIAVQLWELSLADEQAAMDVYQKLLLREESTDFIANAQAAGLASPFDEGEIRRIGELFEACLVEEDWGGALADAA